MKILEWNKYFMEKAEVASKSSKDPNTKVGAILVNDKKIIIGSGYNSMPKENDNFPWNREGNNIDTKYAYVIHAELNAILSAVSKIKDTILYVTLFPCSNCAKMIAHAGVKKIIYKSDKYKGTEDDLIAKKILQLTGVEFEQIK